MPLELNEQFANDLKNRQRLFTIDNSAGRKKWRQFFTADRTVINVWALHYLGMPASY